MQNLHSNISRAHSVSELIKLPNDQFVVCLYKTLLHRAPDLGGFKYYSNRLSKGSSKIEIMFQIHSSSEAKRINASVSGLKEAMNDYNSIKNKLIRKLIGTQHKARSKSDKSGICCIIPYYNGSDFIERALISLYKQTVLADEIIVVNDGSREDESEFVTNLQRKYDFKLINKKNGGQGSARNAGVEACSSKYICLLDQDDFYLPNHNETLLSGIPENEPDFGWVYADLREADGDGLIVRMSMIKEHSVHPKHSLLDLIRNDMFILPSASLININAYKSIGGFDEQFMGYEDDDFFLRLFRHGWSNTFIDKPVTVWCIHSESTSYSVKMSRSRFKYLRKLSAQFPDDAAKARYYFRDLIMPRFGPLIIADANTAKKSDSKDQSELFGYVNEYYDMACKAKGVSEEYLKGLKDLIHDLQ